ncbi:MAG: recombinase RecA [Candidatus Lokiarchaeota archaeon]|nr:recombinase RecA [Candidatus Lokiarchaeota archaeon]
MKKKRTTQKNPSIDIVVENINKKYGDGSLFYGNDGEVVKNIKSIPTGSLALDFATGIGGYPRGRLIEVFGKESSGKTTLALHMLTMAQQMDLNVFFIDVEHALDLNYAISLGLDTNKVLFSQPQSAEEAFDIMKELLNSGKFHVGVVDSVAGLATEAEIKAEVTDKHMAPVARFLSENIKKVSSMCGRTNTTMVFINQTRMKLNVRFGNPETTPGGNALKFFSSLRFEVTNIGKVKVGDNVIGNRTRIKVVKNKVAPPFREAEFLLRYGDGIDFVMETIDYAENMGIIIKKGSFYKYNGNNIGQGKEAVRNYLMEDEETFTNIYNLVRDNLIGE